MKIIFIIIDGLGDRPIPALKNKTPLETAKTPNLDFFAKNGVCGQVLPFKFPWQKDPESDTCHLALFGYDPKKYYLGRGPYEAAGIEMKMKKGDIALRANFATVDRNFRVIDRRAGRISETQSLVKAINGIKIEGLQPPHHPPASGPLVKFFVKKSFGHRAVLLLRCLRFNLKHGELSSQISDGDPKEINEKMKKIIARDRSKEAKFTANVLNKFLERAYQALKNHPFNKKREKLGLLPANYLLVRGAGKFKKTPGFYQKYKLKVCCIAGGALYKGIAKILGMKIIKVRGATGFVNTNLKRKFQAARKALKDYNFVFCHIKAADNLGEDGNFIGKKEFLEKIDKNLKILMNLKNTLIVITGDHSTCSLLKRHCSEPIPILIYGNGRDEIKEFSERSCRKGRLGEIKQLNLLSEVLTLYRQWV